MKAIIFDCYGVLSTESWLAFKQQYFSQDEALFKQASDLNSQVDAGLANYQEFLQKVANLAGLTKETVRLRMESNQPNEALFDYIKTELKPRYKIGLLSNAGNNRLAQLFTPDQLALLDAVALSYESGAAKPHARAYEIIAERLDAAPADCVFVDDQPTNCTAAEATGMRTVVYKSIEQFKQALSQLLVP